LKIYLPSAAFGSPPHLSITDHLSALGYCSNAPGDKVRRRECMLLKLVKIIYKSVKNSIEFISKENIFFYTIVQTITK